MSDRIFICTSARKSQNACRIYDCLIEYQNMSEKCQIQCQKEYIYVTGSTGSTGPGPYRPARALTYYGLYGPAGPCVTGRTRPGIGSSNLGPEMASDMMYIYICIYNTYWCLVGNEGMIHSH